MIVVIRRMPSLAAHLNNAVEGNWIGVFKYAESFYLVAVRDDAVLADCDKVYTDEDDIRDEFSDLFYSSNWENAFAPDEWGMEGCAEKHFDDLLIGVPDVKLRDVSSAKVIIKYGGIAAAGAGVIFGAVTAFNMLFPDSAYEQVSAVYNQVQTKVITKKGVQEQQQEIPPAPPWLGKPTGVGMLATCTSEIRKMPINVPGWEVAGMMCAGGASSMLLERSGGTINWIGYELNKLEDRELPRIIPLSTDNVEVAYGLPTQVSYPELVETYPLQEVRRYLLSHFDEAFLDVKIEESGNSVVFEEDPALPRYYKSLSFSFETPYQPTEFTQILSAIPVFIINKIEYSIEKDIWSVEAEVFEKRKEIIPLDM